MFYSNLLLGLFIQVQNLGQRIWDEVRRYWEYVGEQIENLRNKLGTPWELDGNKMNPKPKQKFLFEVQSSLLAHLSIYLSMKQGSLFVSFVLMRSTKPGCFRSCSCSLLKALNKERGAWAFGSMTFELVAQKFLNIE